jgi:hypothetical protein
MRVFDGRQHAVIRVRVYPTLARSRCRPAGGFNGRRRVAYLASCAALRSSARAPPRIPGIE